MVDWKSLGGFIRPNGTLVRVFSSIVLIPLALGSLYFGGWFFTSIILVAGLAMIFEWASMIDGVSELEPGKPFGRVGGAFFPLAGVGLVALVLAGAGYYALAMVIATLGGLVAFIAANPMSGRRIWAGFGALYLIVPCIALIWLRNDFEYGRILTLMLFVAVWATDIGAFFIGRFVGGPKLNPAVSPKKTWAGTIGGIISGALAFTILGMVFLPTGTPLGHALAGGGLAIASVVGDFVESAMKRGFGVKDSGNLIPGHGGVLDRLDGMIFATIALALSLYIYTVLPGVLSGQG